MGSNVIIIQQDSEIVLAEWPDGESPIFSNCALQRAKLTHLHLPRSQFQECDLKGSVITYCQLDGSIFIKSFLRQCSIAYCSLIDTDFSGADLSGSNLSGSNLSGANLEDCNFTGVTYDNSTIWPKNFLPPDPETHNIDVVFKRLSDRGKNKS